MNKTIIDPLKNIRRWYNGFEKDMIKAKGFAKRVKKESGESCSDSMMNRFLTEDLDKQREPSLKLLPFIIAVAMKYTFNPEVDYTKKKPLLH